MQVLLTSMDNPYTVEYGGKHVHLLLLERGLRSLGVEVTTLYYVRKRSLANFLEGYVSRPLPMYLRYVVRYRNMVSHLSSSIPDRNFDLINAHDVLSLLAIRSRVQRKVLTVHGYFARENIGHPRHMRDNARIRSYYALLEFEREGLNYADYVVTVDSQLKKYIASEFGYSEDKIVVIYNAIDVDRFRPIPQNEQKKLKKDLGYSERDFVLLVPRRLVEKNGVIYAVKAMKYIDSENLRMIIVGDGPEKERIAEEAKGDQRISLIGPVPHRDIDIYYKAADIVLIPSVTSHEVQEASSLAMLEGMSCGKVVICSDIGGMREIVKNMENGMLVREKSPAAIAGAVGIAIEDQFLEGELSRKARAYVLDNHSHLAHAKKILEIYRNVLEEV